MIIEYESKYDESVKELLTELQQHIADLDKEGYNIVGEKYKEKCFEKIVKNIDENNGKILLYEENNKIVGLVIGIIYNEEIESFDFKAPKRGRITDLIITKEYRGKHIGKELLEKMQKYLKSIGCEKILIAVFGYNEDAIEFYKSNGYHMRMIDMIENEEQGSGINE